MKKALKTLLVVMMVALMVVACVACDETPEETIITVTFKNGSEVVKTVELKDGASLKASDLPEDPQADGKEFAGWYNGEAKLEIGKTEITADVTFTAKFTDVEIKPVDVLTVTAEQWSQIMTALSTADNFTVVMGESTLKFAGLNCHMIGESSFEGIISKEGDEYFKYDKANAEAAWTKQALSEKNYNSAMAENKGMVYAAVNAIKDKFDSLTYSDGAYVAETLDLGDDIGEVKNFKITFKNGALVKAEFQVEFASTGGDTQTSGYELKDIGATSIALPNVKTAAELLTDTKWSYSAKVELAFLDGNNVMLDIGNGPQAGIWKDYDEDGGEITIEIDGEDYYFYIGSYGDYFEYGYYYLNKVKSSEPEASANANSNEALADAQSDTDAIAAAYQGEWKAESIWGSCTLSVTETTILLTKDGDEYQISDWQARDGGGYLFEYEEWGWPIECAMYYENNKPYLSITDDIGPVVYELFKVSGEIEDPGDEDEFIYKNTTWLYEYNISLQILKDNKIKLAISGNQFEDAEEGEHEYALENYSYIEATSRTPAYEAAEFKINGNTYYINFFSTDDGFVVQLYLDDYIELTQVADAD